MDEEQKSSTFGEEMSFHYLEGVDLVHDVIDGLRADVDDDFAYFDPTFLENVTDHDMSRYELEDTNDGFSPEAAKKRKRQQAMIAAKKPRKAVGKTAAASGDEEEDDDEEVHGGKSEEGAKIAKERKIAVRKSKKGNPRPIHMKTPEQLAVLSSYYEIDATPPGSDPVRLEELLVKTGLNKNQIQQYFHDTTRMLKRRAARLSAASDSDAASRDRPDPQYPGSKGSRGVGVNDKTREDMSGFGVQRNESAVVDGSGQPERETATRKTPVVKHKTPEQLTILLESFNEDSSSPWRYTPRMNLLVERTGLESSSITNWFSQQRRNAERRGDAVKATGNKDKPQPLAPPTPTAVARAPNGLQPPSRNSGAQAKILPATPHRPQSHPPKDDVMVKRDQQNRNQFGSANSVSDDSPHIDFVAPPSPIPVVYIAPEDMKSGGPKMCGICQDVNPVSKVTSMTEAQTFDRTYGSNLTGFLEYAEFVYVCDWHLENFYDVLEKTTPKMMSRKRLVTGAVPGFGNCDPAAEAE